MADNAEGRLKRAMDRLFPSVQPSTGRGGSKSGTIMMAMSKGNARMVESPAQEKNLSLLHRVCRPWDRGDLFRRLSTFKSMTWFGKPEVAGPLICARNGWVNVDVDLISCEGCNAMLSFPCQPTWSQHEVENAAAAFSKKLESGHTNVCPWKGNACSETLAQFPPTPVEVLVNGFQDRCDSLYQLSALPALSNSTIDFLKQSKESQMERFITHSTATYAPVNETPECSSGSAYFQAQRIISLCGWELRCLPYVVNCEDGNADSLEKTTPSVTGSNFVNTRLNDCGPRVALCPSMKEYAKKNDKGSIETATSEQKCDLGSAVLDCSFCGASVGLWFFSKLPRPHSRTRAEPLLADTDSLICEASATSEIQKGNSDNRIEVDVKCSASDNWLRVDAKPAKVLTLNLTIAGGRCPSSVSQPVESRIKKTCDNYDAQDVLQAGKISLSPEIVEYKDASALNINKRKRNAFQEQREDILQNAGMAPCLSSVNAVDTWFASRPENSAESVEMPSKCQQSALTTAECSHLKRQRSSMDGEAEHTIFCKTSSLPDKTSFEHVSERTGSVVFDENGGPKLDSFTYNRRMPVDGSAGGHVRTIEEMHTLGSTFKKLFDESSREFDPILQHRHFCPWVNSSLGRAGCGWQLTLDALELLPAAVKSESASSMYNVNPLSCVRKIFGKPQKK